MLKDFNAVRISIASPEDILNWSRGEVSKAETINYRTFKPEPGGLMAEEIFGPSKDFECYCGKYKKVRYKGIICDRCGVEITHKRVRRERMGHIKLASPVTHVWFSNGIPNKLAMILGIPQKKLETVIYYARYAVTEINEEEREKVLNALVSVRENELKEIESEMQEKIKEVSERFEKEVKLIKKGSKEKEKVGLQVERILNNEKQEVARIKSAYKQKEENIEKKFIDLKALIQNIILGTTLSEEEFQLLDSYSFYFFKADMGSEAIRDLLSKIEIDKEIELMEKELASTKSDLRKAKLIQRLRLLKGLKKSGVNPSWMVMEILPVIPPDLRPIVQLPGGRFATYDLNDLYRRVINRNNRLKRLIALGAPEIILRNEKRMLQESVDSLLDNNHKPGAPSLNSRQMPFKSLSDMLRGKQGRFRQNLLGKRVDYSGSAVIVPGPELKFHQCGIPKNIALELFKPFIIRELIGRGIAANPAKAKVIFELRTDEVWDILEEVSHDRPVLLNRAPTLHKQSILAFFPVLIEGNAIRLHPMVCTGFNADFDGDQMAVHLPLSDAAVEEVKEKMMAKQNMLNLRDGVPIVRVEKDMAMGLYLLTNIPTSLEVGSRVYSSPEELITAYNLDTLKTNEPAKVLVEGKIIITSPGRAIFNRALPEGHEYINRALGKSDMTQLSGELFNRYGRDMAIDCLDRIKDLGFKYAGRSGFSVSISEFRFGAKAIVEQSLKQYEVLEKKLISDYNEGFITANELRWKKKEEWINYADKIQDDVWALAKTTSDNLVNLQNSGAIAVSAWVKKISGVQGYVTDPSGNIVDLPLKSNFEKGFTNFEYFVSARGARKGFADVALRTADSGYLTRRLVDVAQDIITSEDDCKTEDGIKVLRSDKRLRTFSNRIKGRIAQENISNPKTGEVIVKKGDAISLENARVIEKIEEINSVLVRSPLTCSVAHGVCSKCYGFDNGTGKLIDIGEAAGIIAAQALGEPTTQLTLQSKSGARAVKTDVTQGLPRVEELLEARTPKALALLADEPGVVEIIEEAGGYKVRIKAKKKFAKKFEIKEGYTVTVKEGDKIQQGDTIFKKGKKELKSDVDGKVQIADNYVTVVGTKNVEIEKETEPNTVFLVKDGDIVEKGAQLTLGSSDPKELAKLRGMIDAQSYIIREVQDVYSIQGLEVDDRHLEIIARQMGRYGLVTDAGGSEQYLAGDFVDVLDIEKENIVLGKADKKPIKYERVLMGITNSSIRTESFFSAASFEQQVRVLTDAAIMGKVDYLRGLKENVIIGRPVPLGKVLKKKLGLIKEDEQVENEVREGESEKPEISDLDIQKIMRV